MVLFQGLLEIFPKGRLKNIYSEDIGPWERVLSSQNRLITTNGQTVLKSQGSNKGPWNVHLEVAVLNRLGFDAILLRDGIAMPYLGEPLLGKKFKYDLVREMLAYLEGFHHINPASINVKVPEFSAERFILSRLKGTGAKTSVGRRIATIVKNGGFERLRGNTLIHTDPSLRSWLLKDERLHLIDYEQVSIGNPDIDTAGLELSLYKELGLPPRVETASRELALRFQVLKEALYLLKEYGESSAEEFLVEFQVFW